MASPYKHLTLVATAGLPVVGMPTVLADEGEYLWIQTWGVFWASLQAGCGVAGNVGVVFRHDGSLSEALSAVSSTITNQYAGFVLAESTTQTQGAPFMMLQICP